jgi:hypothetical protein
MELRLIANVLKLKKKKSRKPAVAKVTSKRR